VIGTVDIIDKSKMKARDAHSSMVDRWYNDVQRVTIFYSC